MVSTNFHFGVSKAGLLSSIWIMTATATLLTIARPLVRRFLSRKLYWDDAFQFFAWVLLIGQSAAYTYYIPVNYEVSGIQNGVEPAPSEMVLLDLQRQIFTAQLVIPILFWTCLLCVKFSFLWLYRGMLRGSGAGTKTWWAGFAVVLICYGVILVGVFAECGSAEHLMDPKACSSSSAQEQNYKFLPMQFVFNVFSDLVVMALPLPMLYRLTMPLRQKLAVGLVFSLAWITIAMEILRLVETYHARPEVTWLYTSLETEVAVIVAALPAFSFLVSDSMKSRESRSKLKRLLSLHSLSSKAPSGELYESEPSQHGDSESGKEGSFEREHREDIALPSVGPQKMHSNV